MDDEGLIEAAKAARLQAYAPYSNYLVGAAIVCEDGSIHTGANVENSIYGLSVCAERVAIWSAVAEGRRRITKLALVTADGGFPCGACRQVLFEFADPAGCPVLIADLQGNVRRTDVNALLPEGFRL
ncbi:MAG: cytidine deaminase [Armatimonadetes bacterium]|nr:cytidine deaminase [Armatimonadota bacterium]